MSPDTDCLCCPSVQDFWTSALPAGIPDTPLFHLERSSGELCWRSPGGGELSRTPVGLSCPIQAGGAVPREGTAPFPQIRWKSKVFPCQTCPLCLQNSVRRAGRGLGKARVHRTSPTHIFFQLPRTSEGSDPSQGEEANRWHCAVSAGAQPSWRPEEGCPNAGKALHFRGVSPHAEVQRVSPWRKLHALHLPVQSTVQGRCVCAQPWDITC